jgi:two-component system, NtrC family, sensor kinase
VEVADTGVGMTGSQLARVFEPFFTTRPAGEGTGLGLAICRTIVERHVGRISASSAAGQGTKFAVVLPIVDGRHSTPVRGQSVNPASRAIPKDSA